MPPVRAFAAPPIFLARPATTARRFASSTIACRNVDAVPCGCTRIGASALRAAYCAARDPSMIVPGRSASRARFIEESHRRARRRVWALSGLSTAVLVLIAAIVAPRIYAEYAFRTALDCDKYAAEQDNNVHVPGVEFDQIRVEVAIPACQSANAALPGNGRLMHNLARSLDKAGRYEEAVSWYGKAVELGWAWSQNNLGVLYLYGRGTPMNFAKGVALIRAAAAQNNDQAVLNYTGTDFSILFDGNDTLAGILEKGLVAKGALAPEDVKGRWNANIPAAFDPFKQTAKLLDKGITLRVLNTLGDVDELSAQMPTRRE
jgi:tetratricopeptide (TPR) repeat protein